MKMLIAILVVAGGGVALGNTAGASNGRYQIGQGDWAISCDWQGETTGQAGSDAIGKYSEITFSTRSEGVPMLERIRTYQDRPLVLFSVTYLAASEKKAGAFPVFDRLPANLHIMSYRQKAHSPVAFDGEQSGSPWTVFNDNADTFIISPASHFFVQKIAGDGKTDIRGEVRDSLRNIPAGFTQQTLVAYGNGINRTWDEFGRALTDLEGKIRPANDSDIGLKYLGYWTDNGSYYYYNFDAKLGYGGTLLALADHFRKANIPVGYMQLDSWWYEKSTTTVDGKTQEIKNPKMPAGKWNRYGGLMEYRADPAVFPDGLQDFQKKLGLPIITHNRWIDPKSPYQHQYKTSNYAALDPRYWQNVIGYIHGAGGFGYEQDWLVDIYSHSPALSATVDGGDEFSSGMATAAADDGMTLQYCMPIPPNFLQASEYPNVTTIRTSEDRLRRDRWHDFLYGSRLAFSMGIWPWTDVYLSTEASNVLLSDLSAGMVGFGDQMGTEDKENIFKAVRADGVIVKPDVPIMPVDSTYIAEARGEPGTFVASTYSDHEGHRTYYVLAYRVPAPAHRNRGDAPEDLKAREQIAFEDDAHTREAIFSMGEVGVAGTAYIYDFFGKTVSQPETNGQFKAPLHKEGFNYYVIADAGPSGIALFGDEEKFISSGRQRIASVLETEKEMTVDVVFAAGEPSVRLHGCCASAVRASAGAKELPVSYDAKSGHFEVDVPNGSDGGVGAVEVVLQR